MDQLRLVRQVSNVFSVSVIGLQEEGESMSGPVQPDRGSRGLRG